MKIACIYSPLCYMNGDNSDPTDDGREILIVDIGGFHYG